MFPTGDGRVVVYGGFCKEKVKKVEKGVTHVDMFLLSPDKHDTSGTKWRWQTVKQVGQRPSMRTGLCNAVGKDGKVYMFGGVMDKQGEEGEESDEDSDDEDGNFFNELYTVHVEGERATWYLVTLTGRKEVTEKKRRRKDKGEEDEAMEDDHVDKLEDLVLEDSGPTTVTVESGAFTVSSTVGELEKGAVGGDTMDIMKAKDCFIPSPRFGSGMVYKGGSVYLFGGIIEAGEKDITLKDFYSLDTNKNDSWNVIIESDQVMEWLGDSSDDDEDDEEDEDDESGMDTD